jgi:biotin transport system ATP-binding protein
MTAANIELRGVSVTREGRPALRNVHLALDARRIAIIGENGSGKSTLARLLNGLVTATRGEVRVHGLDPAMQGPEVRRRVGFVFPNPAAQIIMPTVREDLAFSFRGRDLPRNEVRMRVDAALTRSGLQQLADAPAHSLSSGQQQLLAVTAVLSTEPALVVADEPTALLDLRNRETIAQTLLDADAAHQLVIVTHDLELAERCDVAVLVRDGGIEAVDAPAEVVARYRASVA